MLSSPWPWDFPEAQNRKGLSRAINWNIQFLHASSVCLCLSVCLSLSICLSPTDWLAQKSSQPQKCYSFNWLWSWFEILTLLILLRYLLISDCYDFECLNRCCNNILTLLIAFECVAVLPPSVIVFLSLFIFVDNTHITNYHKKTNRKSENEHLSSISWNHNGQCE